MALLLQQTVFYVLGALLLFSSIMVVFSVHPVRAVLFLVLAFLCGCGLWMLLQAEFLSLVLIFVYIGAVMTLFLFVVMMLNLDISPRRKAWLPYVPIAVLVLGLLVVAVINVISPAHFSEEIYRVTQQPATYSNVKALGAVLYTNYAYAFELAAILLLVAIVSAICLVFRGKRKGVKAQRVAEQVAVRPEDRIRLVK